MAICLESRPPPQLATYHIVERGVDVRTVMSIGGWSDCSTLRLSLYSIKELGVDWVYDGSGEQVRPNPRPLGYAVD